jgi:outer membrane protein assembly factor BamD
MLPTPHTPRTALLTAAFVVLSAMGCGHSVVDRINPGEIAKSRYLEGIESLQSGDYEEAIGLFKQVMRVPGYVRLAANARLRIADSLFLQEKFEQAIATYRAFLREYEGDENAPYAQFRIGNAYYEQIPSDWFMAPPRHERQQNAVRQAAAALKQFVRLYPTSPLTEQAQVMLDDCEQQLYAHEAYVASFYYKREKPAGVVQRLERAFDKYPEHAGTEDNYLMLAKAYTLTDRIGSAESVYEAYLDRFPDGQFRRDAAESLDAIRAIERSKPAPAPAPTAPEAAEQPAPDADETTISPDVSPEGAPEPEPNPN